MPGTPQSTGCSACHRRKKKCDEAKPSCGLCRRLGIKCVDNGVRRWKFVHEAAEADAAAAPALVSTSTTTALVSVPRAARRPILSVPQNKTTALTAALVRLLEVRDVRYSVRVFGDQSMEALPSQLGASPELDTTISAVVALYGSRLSGASRVEGLRCYGRALAATRRAVAAYEAAPTVAIHSMLMIWMCQSLIDHGNLERHRGVIVHMFRSAVLQGWVEKLGPMIHGLLQMTAWVSLVQPGFPLEPWFWQAYELCFPDRSSRSQPGAGTYLPSSFRNLDVDAPAYVAMHIQSPVPDIPGLRHLYALIQAEKANMAVLVAECLGIEMPSPGATLDPWSLFEGQALVMWVFGVTMALALESVVNKTLRGLELDELPELLEDAQSAYAEALDLASRCQGLRPMGAGFLPEKLKLVCASTADVVDDSRLRDVLVDYGTDVEGADFVAEADQIRQLLGLYRSRSTSEDSDTVSS